MRFLYGKLSDPVPVVPSVGKQHRSGLETSQKFTSKPIVVGLTRRQRQPNRKAVGFHDRMNLLVNPPRDRPIDCRWFLRCMLMYADNGSVDHLDSRSGKCVYDTAPDTSPPPANEAVMASGVRAERLRRSTQKIPLRTHRSFTRGTSRGFLGSIGSMAAHS